MRNLTATICLTIVVILGSAARLNIQFADEFRKGEQIKWRYKLIVFIFCAPLVIYAVITDSIRQIKIYKSEGKYTKEYYSNISSDFKEGLNDLKKSFYLLTPKGEQEAAEAVAAEAAAAVAAAEEERNDRWKAERERYRNSPEGKAAAIRAEKEFAREKLLEDLEDISGVSNKIARTLLDQFPTVESIKNASVQQLTNIPGVGENISKAIKARIG